MITRLVKLTFREDAVDDFLEVFNQSKKYIRAFEGCQHLKLLREKPEGTVFFTYSEWLDEECLEAYRNSQLFKSTWAQTKILFNDKPQAWTTQVLEVLE